MIEKTRFARRNFWMIAMVVLSGGSFLTLIEGGGGKYLRQVATSFQIRQVMKGFRFRVEGSLFFRGDTLLYALNLEEPATIVFTLDALYLRESPGNVPRQIHVSGTPEQWLQSSYLYAICRQWLDDLGMMELGYRFENSRTEFGYRVTYWKAPASRVAFPHTRIAHDGFLPIYLELQNAHREPVVKVYFRGWSAVQGQYYFPSRIIEIQYFLDPESEKKDSIIRITDFGKWKINEQIVDSFAFLRQIRTLVREAKKSEGE